MFWVITFNHIKLGPIRSNLYHFGIDAKKLFYPLMMLIVMDLKCMLVVQNCPLALCEVLILGKYVIVVG